MRSTELFLLSAGVLMLSIGGVSAAQKQETASKEQKCLTLLGDTYSWSVSQSAMDIAKARETQKRLKDKVRSASDLRESSRIAADIDPNATYLIIVPAKKDVDFEVIQAVLGKPAGESKGTLLQEPFISSVSVEWKKYGWLEFGVSEGKVVAVRGECAILRHGAHSKR